MVLVRFQKKIMEEFSGLTEKDLLEVPWLLGGESRIEGDSYVMEFNPDRPDLYSIQGVSRAIRFFKNFEVYTQSEINDTDFKIISKPPQQRQFFKAGIVSSVDVRRLKENIIDFQEKIHKTIGRDRKLSAIGLHDLSKIKFPLKYMEVDREYSFIPLGEKERVTLKEFMKSNEKAKEYGHLVNEKIPAIIDREGNIISLPPILNSNLTTIDDNTTDIFIDVTGTNDNIVNKTLMLMISSLSYPSGKILRLLINGRKSPILREYRVNIPKKELREILGYTISVDDIKLSLIKMGYGIDGNKIIIPNYRFDILHNIDIVEDIIKGIGYDKVKLKDEEYVTHGKQNKLRMIENKLRNLLLGYGLTEVVNNVLVNGTFNKMYGFNDKALQILNPLSAEQDYIRTRISPSLIQTLLNNYRNPYPQRIYEIGTVYRDEREEDVLGIAIAHREASFSEIKGMIVGILEDLGVKQYEIEKYALPMFVQGRLAKIVINGKNAGFFGEVYPSILKNLGIKMPVAIGELDISEVLL